MRNKYPLNEVWEYSGQKGCEYSNQDMSNSPQFAGNNKKQGLFENKKKKRYDAKITMKKLKNRKLVLETTNRKGDTIIHQRK